MIRLYPQHYLQYWTPKEEHALLVEIDHDMNDHEIALILQRTPGAILARRKEIAYKMHAKGVPMEEIVKKTRLPIDSIRQTIHVKQKIPKKYSHRTQSDYTELQKEITAIKKDTAEILRLMNALYEFEEQ